MHACVIVCVCVCVCVRVARESTYVYVKEEKVYQPSFVPCVIYPLPSVSLHQHCLGSNHKKIYIPSFVVSGSL